MVDFRCTIRNGRVRRGQVSHHEIVLQIFSTVLTRRNLVGQPVFVKRKIGACPITMFVRRPDAGADIHGIFAICSLDEFYRRFGSFLCDGADSICNVVAEESTSIVPAVEQQLGRVDEASPISNACRALAVAILRARKRVAPAEVVPVIDVKAQRHDLLGREPPLRQRAQPAIGRRAAVAAFGSVELEKRHAVLCARRFALRCDSGGRDERG